MHVTPRPTKNILLKAALDAFDAKPAEAQMFASRLVDVIGFCRKKACTATSGKKLSGPVRKVVSVLRRQGEFGSLGEKLVAKARTLQKRASEASSEGARLTKRNRLATIRPNSRAAIMAMHGVREPSSAAGASSSSHMLLPGPVIISGSDSSSIEELSDSCEEVPQATVSPPVTEGSREKGKYCQYLDSEHNCLVRLFPDGILQKAKMKPGSQGFCEAFFDEEGPINTELPNIMLQPIQKRPAGRKRPAAAVAAESSRSRTARTSNPMQDIPSCPLRRNNHPLLCTRLGKRQHHSLLLPLEQRVRLLPLLLFAMSATGTRNYITKTFRATASAKSSAARNKSSH